MAKKSEWKRLLGRQSHKWEDIRMNLWEIR
jgi:hypothetical protein